MEEWAEMKLLQHFGRHIRSIPCILPKQSLQTHFPSMAETNSLIDEDKLQLLSSPPLIVFVSLFFLVISYMRVRGESTTVNRGNFEQILTLPVYFFLKKEKNNLLACVNSMMSCQCMCQKKIT